MRRPAHRPGHPARLGAARRVALLALVALVVPALWAGSAAAGPGEGDIVSLINAERSAQGLPPLTVDARLTEHGRSHSASMAAAGSVFHSLDLASAASGWERMGENVGRGSTATVVHQAFMASPGHRAHVLGDFTHVGVGTHSDAGGMLYVTVAFMRVAGAPAPTTTTTTPPTPTTTSVPETGADTTPTPPSVSAPATSPTTAPAAPTEVRAAEIPGPDGPTGPSADAIADRLAWHPLDPFLR